MMSPMTPTRSDWPTFLFVQFITFAFAILAGWLIYTQGVTDLPLMDEWDLLGEWFLRPDEAKPGWFFSHHCEHRYPLGKLVWMTTLQITNWNFRAPMYLSVGLLTASSLLFQWTARGWRGRSSLVDVLFPALLLHWGHAFNLTMSYQVGFVLFAYGVAGWIWAARLAAANESKLALFLAAFYAGSIAFCGGFGLAFTPAIVGWLLTAAWQWRSKSRWVSAVLIAFAVGIAGYSGWIYATMPKFVVETGLRPTREPLAFAAVALTYLAVGGYGWLAHLPQWVAATVVVLVAAIYACAVFRSLRSKLPLALAAAAIAVLVGECIIGAATAYARGGAMADRYATPSSVGLAVALLVLLTRPQQTGDRWWRGILAMAAAVGLGTFHVTIALIGAMQLRLASDEFRRDVQSGATPILLAGRYGGGRSVLVSDRSAVEMVLFRRGELPLFAELRDDPPYRSETVPGRWPSMLKAESQSEDALVTVAGPPPARARILRIVVRCGPETAMDFVSATASPSGHRQYARINPNGISNGLAFEVRPGDERFEVVLVSFRGDAEVVEAVWLIDDSPAK